MLDIKTRQKYLKELGFYVGANTLIDGSWGPNSKKATLALQKKYFKRKQDQDGLYGPNTDKLLQSAYNCKDSKNFKLTEFRCPCGKCTGYPAVVSKTLVNNLQTMRSKYGRSITITSGLRCTYHNARVGGIAGSSHTKGTAADIYMSLKNLTHNGRVELVNYWDTLAGAKYAYCNGYMKYVGSSSTVYKSKTMGNAVHVNVK